MNGTSVKFHSHLVTTRSLPVSKGQFCSALVENSGPCVLTHRGDVCSLSAIRFCNVLEVCSVFHVVLPFCRMLDGHLISQHGFVKDRYVRQRLPICQG